MSEEKKKVITIDIVEIIIAIMVYIIMWNIVTIRQDIRIINEKTLLQSEKYIKNEEGEILKK